MWFGYSGVNNTDEIVLKFSSSSFLQDELGYGSDDLINVYSSHWSSSEKVRDRKSFSRRYSTCPEISRRPGLPAGPIDQQKFTILDDLCNSKNNGFQKFTS